MALSKPAGSPAAAPAAQASAPGWMKIGAASAQVAKADQAAAEKRKEEQGKAFRFWMNDGEEARITFVDGDLTQTPEGLFLLPPRFYEHNLMLQGRWGNHFVCPQSSNPDSGEKCPICESGDRPTLVALFTVIDHREFESKQDKNKKYRDTVKLLVVNPGSFETLQKLALKVGGLAGTTWEVSRSGDKSPRIGNNWFPVPSPSNGQPKGDFAKLQQMYTRELVDPKTNVKTVVTKFKPLDYFSEIIYRSGDELRAMGLGKPGSAPASGFNSGTSDSSTGEQYQNQL